MKTDTTTTTATTNTSAIAGARDRSGRFFAMPTYGADHASIKAAQARMAEQAATLSPEALGEALLKAKEVQARAEDVADALATEAKGRLLSGEAVPGWKVDLRMRSGKADFKALAEALKTTQADVRARFFPQSESAYLVADV